MNNIILLGSRGNLGKELFKLMNDKFNLFTEKDYSIQELINKEFIQKNNIDFIINCIDEKNKKEFFFISNYALPGNICKTLSSIDATIKKSIVYIHISSIGVNNPFETLNLDDIEIKVNNKISLDYNLYEFSKAAGDFIIKNNIESLNNIKYILIKPSNIIEKIQYFSAN